MFDGSINFAGEWTVYLPDGSTAGNAAKIEAGNEPGQVVFTNEDGATSDGKFISPTLLWAEGFGLYCFAIDSGDTLMWRHSNVCWIRND